MWVQRYWEERNDLLHACSADSLLQQIGCGYRRADRCIARPQLLHTEHCIAQLTCVNPPALAPPRRDFRCGCKCLACCDWVAGDANGNGTAASGSSNDTLAYQCYQATDERPCSPYAKCQVSTGTMHLHMRGLGFDHVQAIAVISSSMACAQGAARSCHPAVSHQDGENMCRLSCNAVSSCPFPTVQSYNDSECGFLYSTADQVGFCPVAEPPLWPALLDVPQVCLGPSMGGWLRLAFIKGKCRSLPPAVLAAWQPAAVRCLGFLTPSLASPRCPTCQERYRGPKAPDLMPNEVPTRGIPPTDAPMLYTGDDSKAAERLMAAMWARQQPITDAVSAG